MREQGTMYPEKGHTIPWSIKVRMKKLTTLEDQMLVDGTKTVYKQILWEQKGKGSIAILFLEPGAKIKRHTHTKDCEFYFSWSTRKKFMKNEFCDLGESHELENTSKKRWLWVLSIKFDRSEEAKTTDLKSN